VAYNYYILLGYEKGYRMVTKSNWKSDLNSILKSEHKKVSQQFVIKIAEIFFGLDFSLEEIKKIIINVEDFVTSYRAYKLVQIEVPTLAQQRVANTEMIKVTEKLLDMLLSTDMGGIKTRISMEINPITQADNAIDFLNVAIEHSNGTYFKPLIKELTKLKSACTHFEEHHYPRLKKLPKQSSLGLGRETPKQMLSFLIASYMKNELNIEPTTYLSDEYERQGVFAEILENCFVEADGSAPSDLKRHIIWACQKVRNTK